VGYASKCLVLSLVFRIIIPCHSLLVLEFRSAKFVLSFLWIFSMTHRQVSTATWTTFVYPRCLHERRKCTVVECMKKVLLAVICIDVATGEFRFFFYAAAGPSESCRGLSGS
ncbi:unnamed protein product, partial [Ectocarpus sp. 12 AP-2014]